MAIAALSPCVLEVREKEEQVHYSQLAMLLQNLHRFTNFKFQLYRKAPFDGYKMEIPVYEQHSTLNNLVAVNIFGTIQKMLASDYLELDDFSPAELPAAFLIGTDPLSDAFRSYLSYLEGKDAVLFVGEDNFSIPRPIEIHTDKTFHMNTSTYVWLELSDVLLPYLKVVDDCDTIFPRASFCSEYNGYVQKTIKDGHLNQAEKNSLYEKVGGVVAAYNLYSKNNHLSRLNSTTGKRRIVYEKSIGKRYYLSLDLESGGFEVFNRSFHHLGQFSFSCNQVKPPEPQNHILNH